MPRRDSAASLTIESLEIRHALTAADLLSTLDEVRGRAAVEVVDAAPLLFNVRQVATAHGDNVGGEVVLQRIRAAWSMPYVFTVQPAKGSSMDPVVALYDGTGARIALNDDVSRDDASSRIEAALEAGGTYYLGVTSYDRGTTGGYAINVAAAVVDDGREPDDTLRAATRITALAGGSYEGVMADAHDYFKVVLTGIGVAGSAVHVDFRDADGDIDLSLLDAAGRRIAVSDGVTDRETISFANLPRGTYYLDVHGYAGAYNPAYTLTSNIRTDASRALGVAADRFETSGGNNTLAKATVLGQVRATSEVKGLTITSKDVDFLKFSIGAAGKAGEEIVVSFQHALGDLDVQLLDATTGRVIQSSAGTGDSETISLAGAPAGTYVLKAYGYKSATNPAYSVRWNYGIPLTAPVALPYSGPPITPPTAPSPGAVGEWTVAVYMTSTDLAPFAFADVNEMEAAVSKFAPGARIALFWDQWVGKPFATGGGTQPAWSTAGRAIIAADTNPNSIATSFEIVGERNTGDPAVLRDFLTWTRLAAPANHYAVVMWDHGGGLAGVNFDDESGSDSLNAKEIKSAVALAGMKPDLIAYDACLMATTEQFYELRDVAPVQVASEEVILGPGYDYTTALKPLNNAPATVTGKALAQSIVASFSTQYVSDGISTLSAIDSTKMSAVAAAMKSFVDAAAGFTEAQLGRIRATAGQVTRFKMPQYVDLVAAMTKLSADPQITAAARRAATGVVNAVNQAVFAKIADERRTGGMALYLPTSEDNESDTSVVPEWIAATNATALVNRVLGRSANSRATGSAFVTYAPRRR